MRWLILRQRMRLHWQTLSRHPVLQYRRRRQPRTAYLQRRRRQEQSKLRQLTALHPRALLGRRRRQEQAPFRRPLLQARRRRCQPPCSCPRPLLRVLLLLPFPTPLCGQKMTRRRRRAGAARPLLPPPTTARPATCPGTARAHHARMARRPRPATATLLPRRAAARRRTRLRTRRRPLQPPSPRAGRRAPSPPKLSLRCWQGRSCPRTRPRARPAAAARAATLRQRAARPAAAPA